MSSRRSLFWNFVLNKRCALCGDRLESSHASNIRKHFFRKHRADYERLVAEKAAHASLLLAAAKRASAAAAAPAITAEKPPNGAQFNALPLNELNRRPEVGDLELHGEERPPFPAFPLLRMQNSTEFPPLYELDATNTTTAGEEANEEEADGTAESPPAAAVNDPVADFAFLLSSFRPEVVNENAQLVADLMRQFYRLGWVFGSGGAMCVRTDEGSVFVTPSAVQKDRLKAEDIGVYDRHHQLVIAPSKPHVVSSCVNLFWTIFRTNDKQIPNRPLNSVIHTHSIEANLMASFPLASGLKYDHVRLSNEEMLKGIVDRACGSMLTNTQTCIIPVIENSPSEGCPEFKERIERAMLEHPGCSAILVRNHGAFYFGYSWQDTKIMAEIFEYLFKLTLEKIKFAPQLAERVFRSSEASK
ncbi:putative methylthioribulose-1-phosphate dehydratase [Aphelenchoides fujianensis]|nr:putative methylthioribulose-1-phosphate dehydratase [Aphelenchoides fujianensis]